MEINTSKSISKITYEDVDVPLVGSGADMLQARVDATNSCEYLFYSYNGSQLPDISKLNTSNVTSMAKMFRECSKLIYLDVSFLKTSNVTNISNMFGMCSELTTINGISDLDISKVINMNELFGASPKLNILNLNKWNTSNVTNMSNVFYMCRGLTELYINNWDTSKVTTMNSMFSSCVALTELDISNFDTSKVTNMGSIFNNCSKLVTILGTIDLIKAGNVTSILNGCKALTTVTLKNIKTALTIGSGTSYGHLLTLDTLINTIKELWDYSGSSTTYKLTIGSANLEKIANTYVKLITPTEEQIAADPNITSKLPCVVCESTEEGAMLLTDYAFEKGWTIV